MKSRYSRTDAFIKRCQDMSNKLDCTITMTTPVGGEQVLAKPQEALSPRQLREQAVNYMVHRAITPTTDNCYHCVHYKCTISSCPILPGHVHPLGHCEMFMKEVPTKKAVNYKIIGGMRAVGNQCRDCRYAYDSEICGRLECTMLQETVSPQGRCERFKDREEA